MIGLKRRATHVRKLPAGTLAVGSATDGMIFDLNQAWRYDARKGFSPSLPPLGPASSSKVAGR